MPSPTQHISFLFDVPASADLDCLKTTLPSHLGDHHTMRLSDYRHHPKPFVVVFASSEVDFKAPLSSTIPFGNQNLRVEQFSHSGSGPDWSMLVTAEADATSKNEKLAEEGKSAQGKDVLRSRLGAIEDEFARLEKERGTGKATLKRDKAPEKLVEAIDRLEDKIKAFKLQMVDREAGKEVALGTSKINYLDPRITAAWCKKYDVPIEKIFSKTLLTKFPWAMEVDIDWKF